MTKAVIAGRKAGLSLRAAFLLETIAFWQARAHARWRDRDCRYWAQTRKQVQDLTGFTEWELRKAIEELKSKGRIEVQQHKFHGISQSFFRVLEPIGGNPGWRMLSNPGWRTSSIPKEYS